VPGMSKLVEVHFREEVARGESAVLTLRWQATRPGGRLFPALDADIGWPRRGAFRPAVAGRGLPASARCGGRGPGQGGLFSRTPAYVGNQPPGNPRLQLPRGEAKVKVAQGPHLGAAGPPKPARRPSRTVTSTEAAHWAKSNISPNLLYLTFGLQQAVSARRCGSSGAANKLITEVAALRRAFSASSLAGGSLQAQPAPGGSEVSRGVGRRSPCRGAPTRRPARCMGTMGWGWTGRRARSPPLRRAADRSGPGRCRRRWCRGSARSRPVSAR
jgi:hypothetical protein